MHDGTSQNAVACLDIALDPESIGGREQTDRDRVGDAVEVECLPLRLEDPVDDTGNLLHPLHRYHGDVVQHGQEVLDGSARDQHAFHHLGRSDAVRHWNRSLPQCVPSSQYSVTIRTDEWRDTWFTTRRSAGERPVTSHTQQAFSLRGANGMGGRGVFTDPDDTTPSSSLARSAFPTAARWRVGRGSAAIRPRPPRRHHKQLACKWDSEPFPEETSRSTL